MSEKEENLEKSQVYEAGFHILPTVPEEKLQEVVLGLENSINKNDGTIISQEFPKIRALSYEIKRKVEAKYLSFNKAYFGWIKFETIPTSIDKIEKELKSSNNILRFIIVKTIKENTMYTFNKSPLINRENNKEETIRVSKDVAVREKVEVSEEELDKSIDELLTN